MNRQQKMVLVTVLAMLVASVVYVPWDLSFGNGRKAMVYGLVFAPPTAGVADGTFGDPVSAKSRSVAWGWLAQTWLIVLASAGTGLAANGRRAGTKAR
jgi:hypothetical protein